MTDDALKSVLRDGAAQDAPAFSPLLHERIVARLREVSPEKMAQKPLRFRMALPFAAAASLLICGGVYLAIHRGTPVPVRPSPAVAVIPSPREITGPVDQFLAAAAAPARQTLDDGKYAYLDHDAQCFVSFLADQIPGAPAETAPKAPR